MTGDEARATKEVRLVPRRFKLALIGVAVLLLVTLPLWAPLFMRRMNFFRVRRLEIAGTRYIPATDIVARAHVDTTRSVWDRMDQIADRVRTHPGVQRVEVNRKLPGTLVITVTEYQPIALVPGPQGFRVFDERGVALPIDPSRIDVDAPVLASADPALLHLLAGMKRSLAPLYSRVSELKRVGTHELLFLLDEVPVRTLTTVSLDDLHQIDAVEDDLRKRSAHALEFDLRYTDQIIARLP
jgi:cell division septal protein FtsQ